MLGCCATIISLAIPAKDGAYKPTVSFTKLLILIFRTMNITYKLVSAILAISVTLAGATPVRYICALPIHDLMSFAQVTIPIEPCRIGHHCIDSTVGPTPVSRLQTWGSYFMLNISPWLGHCLGFPRDLTCQGSCRIISDWNVTRLRDYLYLHSYCEDQNHA